MRKTIEVGALSAAAIAVVALVADDMRRRERLPTQDEKTFAEFVNRTYSDTNLALITGEQAVAMIDCANRLADPKAPLIPADFEIFGGSEANVRVVKMDTIEKDSGKVLESDYWLQAYSNEGASAEKTYGDKQFWYAHGLRLDAAGNIISVRQLDQSIGFGSEPGDYDRDTAAELTGGTNTTVRSDANKEASLTPEQARVLRNGVSGCYKVALDKAFPG